MNHTANMRSLAAAGWSFLECESTAAELGPHVTQEDMRMLRDVASLAQSILHARKIKPATEWRTPTEVRKAVAAHSGKGREFVGPRRRRV